MKQMKMRCVLLIFLGTVFCLAVAAQSYSKSQQDANAWAEKRTEMMERNLSLSPDQVDKVRKINLDYARKMNGASGDSWKRLDNERDAELKKVLTAAQYRKWEGNKKDWVDKLKAAWNKTKGKVKEAADDVKDKVDDLKK